MRRSQLISYETEENRVIRGKRLLTKLRRPEVLGAVSSENHVMSPHFFQEGLRVNAAGYFRVCWRR